MRLPIKFQVLIISLFLIFASTNLYAWTVGPPPDIPDSSAWTGWVRVDAGTWSVSENVTHEAYDATGWDGDNAAATKDAIRDKIESMGSSGGDISDVLDCATGDCTELLQAPAVFTDGDTTPDVSSGTVFITANTSSTTISDFDTSLANGEMIFIIVNDAYTTFDMTSSGLEGVGGVDYAATTGDLVIGLYSTTDSQWHMLFFPSTINVSSIEVPNGTNPTTDAEGEIAWDTDDTAVEWYVVDAEGVTGSYLTSIIESHSVTLPTPDDMQSENDDWVLWKFPAEEYPHGVKMLYIHVDTSSAVTDTFLFEEWDDSVGSTQATCESIALTGASSGEDDGTLSDSDFAADSFLNVNLDGSSDDYSFAVITFGFLAKSGD